MENSKLAPNSLAFIALSNEFCSAIENAMEFEKEDFVAKMLKMLPRIYMTITDIDIEESNEDYYALPYLDESVYDNLRSQLAALMGEDDVFLETFEEDMKYSDAPVSATISEDLADIYQQLYNFVASVRDVDTEAINSIIITCKEDFASYWGQTLCNVLRALHSVFYNKQD
ncbi:MAG: DUF5063 domain-containing protein [Muribaculaceae bacterium]|nr:DUF5063 domain-containing protein [Muribaculaceae bacterium]